MESRYRLVAVLRAMNVSERHIRATLYSELGLSPEEADEALTVSGAAESDVEPADE